MSNSVLQDTMSTNSNLEISNNHSRNKFTVERMRYFGHLAGGITTALHSRFFARRPRPFTFSHMVTSKCNANCSFCFWKHHKDNEDLTLPEIQRIYAEAKKEGYMNSILWGGEPLLRQDFTEIAKASHDNGMYTKMATNGWFLEENHEFGKYMDLIFVSVDAIGEKHDIARGNMHGLYDRCIRGMEFHKKHYPKMRIYICCTVSKENTLEDLTEVAQLCKDMDILLYFTVNKSYQDFSKWEGKDGLTELEHEAEKLSEIFKGLKSLKKQGYPIRNSYYFMDYLIAKKNYYECHWPQIATVMYSNGILLRCFDRKPMENLDLRKISLGEALRTKEFIDMANSCKDCQFSCVGNYALDASGIWRFDWPAIKSIAEIAIT